MRKESLWRIREIARPRGQGCQAFSLIEVVIALAICSFSLVVMLELLAVGLQGNMDSREQMQAADLATLIITPRYNAPTNSLANVLLPPMTNLLPATATSTWVNSDGQVVASLAQAEYTLSYKVGYLAAATNTGMIYIRLTWPPGANAATAQGHYEQATQVLLP